MIQLPASLRAWRTPGFEAVFKREVGSLELSLLPLERCLSQGSHVSSGEPGVMLISQSEGETSIQVKAGIFFSSVIAGCSCADDPTPIDRLAEYCELRFEIDKESGATLITPID